MHTELVDQINEQVIPAEKVREQLKSIITSTEMGQSVRLQMMLEYVVEESLAGRDRYIKGSTIGNAIFDQNGDFDPNTNSIVRVEMGRLRRRLAEYYAGSGQQAPILITIPKGSYVPDFSFNPEAAEVQTEAQSEKKGRTYPQANIWSIILSVLVLGALLLTWLYPQHQEPSPETAEITPGTLSQDMVNPEAISMFRQAFILLMPPEDNARLTTASTLFQRVMDLAPDFAGGYAGKSIAHSTAVFFIMTDTPEKHLSEARDLAEKAIEINPNYQLGYSALALAQALSNNKAEVMEQVKRSISIRPRNPNANAMTALALLFIDEHVKAKELLDEAIKLNPAERRTPYLNIQGIAHYQAEQYDQSTASFETNIDRGGPSGPHIWILLAASYEMSGRGFEAQAIIDKLKQTSPDYPYEAWLGNFISSDIALAELMAKLRDRGLP